MWLDVAGCGWMWLDVPVLACDRAVTRCTVAPAHHRTTTPLHWRTCARLHCIQANAIGTASLSLAISLRPSPPSPPPPCRS